MQVTIERDGTVELVDVDLESGLTAKQMVRFQKALGDDRFDQLVEGKMRPDALMALVWAKLASTHPDVTLEDIDFDIAAAEAEMDEDGPGKEPAPDTSE